MNRKMTDKALLKEFNHLNERFFDDRIVLNRLGFSSKTLPGDASGAYYHNYRWILISSGLKEYHNVVTMILLHEMIHADLHIRGYLGYPVDGGHGSQFQIEIDKLYKTGAYDGIL